MGIYIYSVYIYNIIMSTPDLSKPWLIFFVVLPPNSDFDGYWNGTPPIFNSRKRGLWKSGVDIIDIRPIDFQVGGLEPWNFMTFPSYWE